MATKDILEALPKGILKLRVKKNIPAGMTRLMKMLLNLTVQMNP